MDILFRDLGQPARLVVTGHVDATEVAEFREALAGAADHVEPVVVDLTGVSGLSGAGVRALREHEENFVAVLVNLHSEVGQALAEDGMSRLVYRPRRRPGRLAATPAARRNRAQRRWPHATAGTRSRS